MSDEWTSESESEDDVIIETDDESEEEVLAPTPSPSPEPEAPKPRQRGRPPKPIVEKPTGKRKMSEAQLAALARGRAKRDAGRLERKTASQKAKELKEAETKKRRDAMAVKKATKIKKKEAIEEAALMLSSEDEMDDLEVRQVKRVVAKRKTAAKKKAAANKVIKDAPADTQPQFVFY